MVIIRTKYFLMVVGIAAALMAAGCASEVVEAPAVEPAAGEAPMAEAVMEPDTPEAPMAEAAMEPDTPEAPMAEAAMEPDTPEAPMAEAAMEPDTPVTEEFLNFGVGTVRVRPKIS